MRPEHKEIQSWILDHYGDKYEVAAEITRQNRLPDRKRHWYQPDVVIRRSDGEIAYIIEIECDPVRKALVGASILADKCIDELGQMSKPRLLFVIYTEDGIRQIHNFSEKLELAKGYCGHLESIEVYSESEFRTLRL